MPRTMRTNRRTRGKFFIQDAIKHPGALINYVENTYGAKGFTTNDTIKPSVIKKIKSGKCPVCVGGKCTCPTKLTRQRARLAATLRSFN